MFRNILIILLGLLIHLQSANASHVYCHKDKGKVARAVFSTDVKNREPVDEVLVLTNDSKEVYFFSDLRQFDGQKITHQWEYEGKVIQRKDFVIKGPRWRVYSKHDIDPLMVGKWTVIIMNEDGCPLKAVRFNYIKNNAGKPKIIKK